MSRLREELSTLLPMLAEEHITQVAEVLDPVLEQLVAIEQSSGSFEETRHPSASSAFLRVELMFLTLTKLAKLLPFEWRLQVYQARQQRDSLETRVKAWCDEHEFPWDSGLMAFFRYFSWWAYRSSESLLSPIERKYLELLAAQSQPQPKVAVVDEVMPDSKTARKLRRLYRQFRDEGYTREAPLARRSIGTVLGRILEECGSDSSESVRTALLREQVATIRHAMGQQGLTKAHLSLHCLIARSTVTQALRRPTLTMQTGTLTRLSVAVGVPIFGIVAPKKPPVDDLDELRKTITAELSRDLLSDPFPFQY